VYKYFHNLGGIMYYNPPKTEGQEQWIPIVAKNKDWLVGYISGIQMIESIIHNSLEENKIEIDFRGLDLCLDSSRFNDIMEDGKRESECTQNEIKKYYERIIGEKIDMIKEQHPDNGQVLQDYFLEVECSCGLGIFLFKTPKEVPDQQFRCSVCGKVVIDYTDRNDEEFDYSGDASKRVQLIAEELAKKIEQESEEDEDED